MATTENRSCYTVSVKHREDLSRTFPYTQLKQAKAYCADLLGQNLKPRLTQLEDTIAIRIRQKGHPSMNLTAGSLQEAEDIIVRIESERRQGLFIDYTKAHQVSFTDIIRRYMAEVGPQHKGWQKVERYKCQGWLDDIAGNLARRDARRAAEQKKGGKITTTRGAMRAPATGLEWMEKPFAHVKTTDIMNYIKDRGEVVMKSTVDREIDVIAAICNYAIEVWKYRVAENPMVGVKRPSYFNERDRRLKRGELDKILIAAAEEDRLRSIQLRTEELMAEARAQAVASPSLYQHKSIIKAALPECRSQAELDYEHVALYETFINFQLMTAARRGETLNVTWDNVDLEARTVYLPETKNGRPRKLPLRAALVEMLKALPQTEDRVFPLSEDALKKAWARIGQTAAADDLHIHDLRHESISQAAETGKFSLIDLQAFSGHRDVRMLLRYSHLCTTHLAHRLDEAFATEVETSTTQIHRGRRRLRAGQGMSVAAIIADAPQDEPPGLVEDTPAISNSPSGTNVIAFPSRRTR